MEKLTNSAYLNRYGKAGLRKYPKPNHHICLHIQDKFKDIVGTNMMHLLIDEPDEEFGDALMSAGRFGIERITYNGTDIDTSAGELWKLILGIKE